jgi:hypothetical protein
VLRYGLQIKPSEDATYKENLVKYILESGGKVIITLIGEHGKIYEVSRILGEKPTVLDHEGNDLLISVASIIRNPLYFGQKDLAMTKPGYEFDLLHKLVGARVVNQEDAVAEQAGTLSKSIELFNSIAEIPAQITELEGQQREIEHKLAIFKEKGITEKLEKQTSCNEDKAKLGEILNEIYKLKNCLTYNFWPLYDIDAVSLSSYTSKYNVEIFKKAQEKVASFITHMADITKATKDIETDIKTT